MCTSTGTLTFIYLFIFFLDTTLPYQQDTCTLQGIRITSCVCVCVTVCMLQQNICHRQIKGLDRRSGGGRGFSYDIITQTGRSAV